MALLLATLSAETTELPAEKRLKELRRGTKVRDEIIETLAIHPSGKLFAVIRNFRSARKSVVVLYNMKGRALALVHS